MQTYKEKFQKWLQISIFDVEEISDLDLQIIVDTMKGIPNKYAKGLAERQLYNEKIYMSIKELDPTIFSERLIKMHKEHNET